MFEKEIDEIYELCKRVVNEVPTANASFNYSIYGILSSLEFNMTGVDPL